MYQEFDARMTYLHVYTYEAESRFWFCGLQTQQLGLVVGRPTFLISSQDYFRNDLRRSNIQKFSWESMPPRPIQQAPYALFQSRAGTPLLKILDPLM